MERLQGCININDEYIGGGAGILIALLIAILCKPFCSNNSSGVGLCKEFSCPTIQPRTIPFGERLGAVSGVSCWTSMKIAIFHKVQVSNCRKNVVKFHVFPVMLTSDHHFGEASNKKMIMVALKLHGSVDPRLSAMMATVSASMCLVMLII
jgi:hypothetical protein